MEECKKPFCPWVQSNQDPDHYVCLTCGRHRRITDYSSLSFVVMVVVAILIGVALVDVTTPTPDPTLPAVESSHK